MGKETYQIAGALVAAAGPLMLLIFGLLPTSVLNRNTMFAARTASKISLASFGLGLAAVVVRVCFGPVDVSFIIAGPVRVGVYFDNLSAVVLTLVSFLLAVVSRYSVNYLAGDPGQGRFTKWLCLTGGSVLAIIISGNLIQFALAWSSTSLCLHQLLVFYPDRPGAILAARKKFIISRMGDACLLTVIVLTYRQFHTWDFSGIFAIARQLQNSGLPAHHIEFTAICFLLVAGAMLKSAQFPFHSWLPDTMETPTPVSALMHAGIINAGGFLIIRLNPLLTLSPAAMSILALFGAFTALFASLVMLTHASVKRSLAFSTVAQMGFMMLECGLGAFGLAVLHLVAHSLYKAHAFLSSGNIAVIAKSAWSPAQRPNARPLTLIAVFSTAIAMALGSSWVFGMEYSHEPALFLLGVTFAMALAYTLWNLWSQPLNSKLVMFGLFFGGGIMGVYGLLHKIFGHIVTEKPWVNAQLNSRPGLVLITTLLLLFLFVLVVQMELPNWTNRPFFKAAYVHARNGFYFNTLANKAITVLWPLKNKDS